jgi:phage terminase large subunit GpA-like protein
MPSQLTIRGVPDEVAKRLARLSKERKESLNSTVLALLAEGVGVNERRARLERYATWSIQEAAAFDRKVVKGRPIDDDLWR